MALAHKEEGQDQTRLGHKQEDQMVQASKEK